MHINPIKSNMTELHGNNGAVILFSYRTPVAVKLAWPEFGNGVKYLRTAKKYSSTTTRHINYWLDGNPAETVPQEEIDTFAD